MGRAANLITLTLSTGRIFGKGDTEASGAGRVQSFAAELDRTRATGVTTDFVLFQRQGDRVVTQGLFLISPVDRGYVRPEDEAPAVDPEVGLDVDGSSPADQEPGHTSPCAAITIAGHLADAEEEDEDEDTARPLPDRLTTELTAHRTLALRDALAENPVVTFQAVLHNFVLTAFYRFASSGSCLEIGLQTPTFPSQAPV